VYAHRAKKDSSTWWKKEESMEERQDRASEDEICTDPEAARYNKARDEARAIK
jgi:hypothetical protein